MTRLASAKGRRATPAVPRGAGARTRPSPLPHDECLRGRTNGVGEGKGVQGVREGRPSRSAPMLAHARPDGARPSRRTLILPGALGEGVPKSLSDSLPNAQTTDSQPPPLKALWPGAHHVSGSEKETARRVGRDGSRRSCCRDPTERGLSRPLPFSMSRTMRGGAGFRRSSRRPTGNEVRMSCAVLELTG